LLSSSKLVSIFLEEDVGADDHNKSKDPLSGKGQTDSAGCDFLESGNSGLASTSSHPKIPRFRIAAAT